MIFLHRMARNAVTRPAHGKVGCLGRQLLKAGRSAPTMASFTRSGVLNESWKRA